MSFRHHNITGEFTNELIAPRDNGNISSISLANVEGTWPCLVDLWIEKKLTGKFYYMKQVLIPVNSSLNFNLSSFDNSTDGWGLYIKLTKSASETPAIDVIIN